MCGFLPRSHAPPVRATIMGIAALAHYCTCVDHKTIHKTKTARADPEPQLIFSAAKPTDSLTPGHRGALSVFMDGCTCSSIQSSSLIVWPPLFNRILLNLLDSWSEGKVYIEEFPIQDPGAFQSES
ncbi:hypothetical protein MRB53_012763 [Persea americana]|uniref:Uncharacterized protein n=1 Tax=Persea americana TaxID=3435 RepID=A0ACC2LZI4_PERAE|nr:hypothetical protein MRB53_012763 [Persea americana]